MSTLDDMKKHAGGSLVELPGFTSEESFTVTLKRPSLLALASNGKIPNPLLSTATELFRDGVAKTSGDATKIKDTWEILKTIAQASLVSPTYKEIEEAGIELTDMQLICIYNYVQSGVDALKVFRGQQKFNEDIESGNNAGKAAE